MTTRKRRRRAAGDGAVFDYQTRKGTRYGVKFWAEIEGERRQILRRRGPHGETWTSYTEASKALRDMLGQVDRNEWADPSKIALGEWLDLWAAGLRLAPSTIASYRKNIRLHIRPALGGAPLRTLSPARIDVWLRGLEGNGRVDHKAGTGLSARTTRYVFTILSAALRAAVDQGLLVRNPCERAHPPSAKQARPPEMHVWTGAQLRTFLDWSAAAGEHLNTAWLTLATCGVRRGELLALRWRDIDLVDGKISVRRSVGLVRVEGHAKRQVVEGPTKTGRARVVDLDEATATALRTYRKERGSLALALARDDAYVFGTLEGRPRQPEHFTRDWGSALARCQTALGEHAPPVIRLHDLRHTHASLLLRAGMPVKVVSERLGHTSPTITLSVYAHVLPGMQREAADAFAALVFGGR